MPNEARLQREQQDAPTAVSSTELQEIQPADEPTREEQQNLRRSTRQTKPAQRLIEAMQAELQDPNLPGEIFHCTSMRPRNSQTENVSSKPSKRKLKGQPTMGTFP
jgi:hypothetical protein